MAVEVVEDLVGSVLRVVRVEMQTLLQPGWTMVVE